jgi:hypothetical protein
VVPIQVGQGPQRPSRSRAAAHARASSDTKPVLYDESRSSVVPTFK